MKYSIWCFLFGHRFIGQKHDGGKTYDVFPVDWCSRCGLSKKEAGITSSNN